MGKRREAQGAGPAPEAAIVGRAAAFPAAIGELVEAFRDQKTLIKQGAIKEHAIRKTFIDPVLQELGWLISPGLGRLGGDVVEEDSQLVDGRMKAPDYGFYVDRRLKFYLEAKKPSVNLDTSQKAAYQIRNYCWNAGLPRGIVTDFEEWAIYDCNYAPDPEDSSKVARVDYFTYEDLAVKWGWLHEQFSRQAVEAGSLDSYIAGANRPAGKQAVDASFLAEIRSWRQILAQDAWSRDPNLSQEALNSGVQDLIDRIVFLRIAEARGIEPAREMEGIAKGNAGAYGELQKLFVRANDRYNSGLFKGAVDSSRVAAGAPNFVGDEALTWLLPRLYFPFPYEFSVMPADILGRVYEQFLGETISVTTTGVSVDLKPEVRKAGGVFYTPSPVVDYIVEEALTPIVEGSTPSVVDKLRILDPACGSGSFLVAAYQFLIDWYTQYYLDHPNLRKRHIETPRGRPPRLVTSERRRILMNSIFGVDIDRQAVEVTKLSLMLKLIEGQEQGEIEGIGRILPNLDANVRCGNSLVDTDFPMPIEATPQEAALYAPFNWREEFPAVVTANGSFDVVIGNPPYFNVDRVWGAHDPRLQYLKQSYSSVYTDKTDILFYFFARAAQICDGEISFIVSRAFLEADKAKLLRSWLSKNVRVREVLDFRDAMVFGAAINTAIVRLTKSKSLKKARFRRVGLAKLPLGYSARLLREATWISEVEVPVGRLSGTAWNFGNVPVERLLAKIDAHGTPVGEILLVGKGMETARNEVFTFSAADLPYLGLADELLASGYCLRRARNSDIRAFEISAGGVYAVFPERAKSFDDLPPFIQDRLTANESKLKQRKAFQRGDCDWWRFAWPLHLDAFTRPRILCPYRAADNRFAVDSQAEFIGLTDTTVLYDNSQHESLDYLAAVLNSKVLTFRFRFIAKLTGGGAYEYFENTVSRLPIPRLKEGDSRADVIAELARELAELRSELASNKSPVERGLITEQVAKNLWVIEKQVADLFNLTDEEVALIDTALEAGAPSGA